MMNGRPDAQGMRHAASQMRSKVDRVSAVVNRLEAQVGSMVYAGPAAEQFRAAMEYERWRLREIARILGQAADVLTQGAASVEADPTGFYSADSTGAVAP